MIACRRLTDLTISLPRPMRTRDFLLLRHLPNLTTLSVAFEYHHRRDYDLDNHYLHPSFMKLELRLKKLEVHHRSFLDILGLSCPEIKGFYPYRAPFC